MSSSSSCRHRRRRVDRLVAGGFRPASGNDECDALRPSYNRCDEGCAVRGSRRGDVCGGRSSVERGSSQRRRCCRLVPNAHDVSLSGGPNGACVQPAASGTSSARQPRVERSCGAVGAQSTPNRDRPDPWTVATTSRTASAHARSPRLPSRGMCTAANPPSFFAACWLVGPIATATCLLRLSAATRALQTAAADGLPIVTTCAARAAASSSACHVAGTVEYASIRSH